MSAHERLVSVYLARHGETEWSLGGRHTSRSEVPLTAHGEEEARALGERLCGVEFGRVFVSPRARARRTYELSGLGATMETDPDLAEWDYGDYEGLRTAEIRAKRPDWNLFHDGCPGGESPAQVAARADRVIARWRTLSGHVAIFTHGHFGRVLGARWVNFPVEHAQRLLLSTASVSVLGYEHHCIEEPVIAAWNGT